MSKRFFLLILILHLLGCQKITKSLEGNNYSEVVSIQRSQNISEFNLLYTGNVNGETNPCGCRKFPLGGIPQIYGLIESEKKMLPTLLVDAGDTFFPSSQIPTSMHQSLSFIAKQIAKSMSQMGYIAMVPGDQDFALGQDFLRTIVEENSFKLLMTNASNINKIPHLKKLQLKSGDRTIHILGITDPSLMPAQHRMLFTDPIKTLESEIKTIMQEKAKSDLVFLISHSGMENDQQIAKQFPQIDWIIGAHSMSYNTIPITEGDTQITQVLSRNHYIGKITIPFGSNKNLKYSILESRDEAQNLISPNPMKQFLDDHKQKLLEIQTLEQKQMMTNSGDIDFIPTANSCLECHDKQTTFWEKTPHSIAYATLYKNNAHMNSQCIECHSVGFQKEGGFQRPMDFAYHDKKPIESKDYTQELGRIFAGIKSVREASPEKIVEVRRSWNKLDKKFKVDHNFANVQCLNCHDQAAGHPFTIEEKKVVNYQHKCIQCHTQDQSPDWYEKASTQIIQKTFNQNLKKVACPKGKAQL